jgi:ectoine hydroxylase-related dioxygenase (phytanoyl-CoA dioxygenase family)
MHVPHVPADSQAAEVAALLAEHGCLVVDALAPTSLVDAVLEELAPFMAATPAGPDDFSGTLTRRTGSLIARSPASRTLVADPLVVESTRLTLAHATSVQLHLTQLIAIEPGQPAQPIHRDQWAYDFFSFPADVDVQVSTMWAFDDFTERNGATRVIPDSHRAEDKLRFCTDDSVPAEMAKGSVLLYTGSLYHGGGANQSDAVRRGCNIDYNVSWLRQEENQYLATPFDVARELPDDLLRLMGYARGAYALGYVGDLCDPLDVLRGTSGMRGFGELTPGG